MNIQKNKYTIFTAISELITNSGVQQKEGCRLQPEDLGIIKDAALVVSNGKLHWFGPESALPKEFLENAGAIKKVNGFVSPCLVDAHTHFLFAGSRAGEFEKRLAGQTYQQIAAAGGGIQSSVAALRDCDEKTLEMQLVRKLMAYLAEGVRVLEIKTGYGLSFESEMKSLRVLQRVRQHFADKGLRVEVTFMAAHAIPKEFRGNTQAYVELMVEQMLPEVSAQNLATACDVFCDEGYFTNDQTRQILSAAKQHGLKIKMHADELANTQGAALAAELGCLSADHLLKADRDGLSKMASGGTVAVVLPMTGLYLGIGYAPVDAMRELGVCMAVASDYNPGTSPTSSLSVAMALAVLGAGMKPHEAFAGVTYNASRALGLSDIYGFIYSEIPTDHLISFPWVPSYLDLITAPGDRTIRACDLSDL